MDKLQEKALHDKIEEKIRDSLDAGEQMSSYGVNERAKELTREIIGMVRDNDKKAKASTLIHCHQCGFSKEDSRAIATISHLDKICPRCGKLVSLYNNEKNN